MKIRVGLGYDVHQLSRGLPLILGGIKLDSELGIVAYSDGDILCHALMDALLGAANLGDIGNHFPDDKLENKNRSSLEMLAAVWTLIQSKGFEWGNADIVLSLEKPKLGTLKKQIQQEVAAALNVSSEDISIKATTEEGLGFVGKHEGISCRAVVLINKV